MATSGNFQNYPVSNFGLYCEWSSVQSKSGNYDDITLKVYAYFYHLQIGARSGATISINGVSETFTTPAINDTTSTSRHYLLLKTKTVRVYHNADGTKTGVQLSASWSPKVTYSGTYVGTITASTTVALNSIETYKLTLSAAQGSNIIANRTASGYANTGTLSNGSRLYYGDTLKITFTPSSNYEIVDHKVNNNTFTSGNTHTVTGNVSIQASARLLASSVGATDANIGSNSTITVTKYGSSYYHSLHYEFEGLNGWINADGTISVTEVKYTNTSVSFIIPESFYNQIPNSSTGKCTITCRTYTGADSTTVLGSPTQCKITVTATGAPVVSGVVIDINEKTTALTGDNTVLVRYMSTAQATITATAQNGASIKEKRINGILLEDSSAVEIEKVEATSFVFTAVDSRGYSTSVTVVPKGIVPYIPLTINPVVSRSSPTSNLVQLTFNGNWFNGYFDEDKGEEEKSKKNSITITYRFRTYPTPEGQGYDWSEWQEIDADKIIKQTGSYNSDGAITLTGFDYQKSYVVTIKVTDGTLTTAAKTLQLAKGVPVFDWGEDDFNFNVDVKINNKNIYDIMYPINSVYVSVVNTLPETLSAIGTWESITTGIAGTFAWKRIENDNSQ